MTGNPVTFITSSKAGGSTSTILINKPIGVVAGDLMIVFLCAASSTNGRTWTGDTGWNEVIDQSNAPNMRVAWLVAGASEPTDYTFTCSSGTPVLAGVIVAFRNAAYDTIGTINTANPIVAPQITAASNGSVLLAFFCDNVATDAFTTPTGMATVNSRSVASAPSWNLFSQSIDSGATGSRTSTPTTGTTPAGVLVSIKPG